MKDTLKEGANTYSVPNLERALSVFELLMVEGNAMTLAEIQERTGFPKSSLFRIVQTLTDRSYLMKNENTGAFTLSKKFLHLGLSTLSESSLIENCLPVMRQLRNELKETVLLGTLLDREGVLLEQVMGQHPFTFMLKAGKRFILHASAPGKAILAYLPEEEREQMISAISFERYNDKTITSPVDFAKDLEMVRERGYGIDHAEELVGVHCVGAPIFNHHGYPIAALWITAPSVRLQEENFSRVGERLRNAGLAISKLYGFDGH